MRKNSFANFSIAGFCLFFATILITSTGSIVVYYYSTKYANGNVWVVILSVLGIILVGAGLCTAIDMLRRKLMIDEPVELILDATEKIASGDFSVKLAPIHDFSKYNQYDIIFENINIMTAELSKNELLKQDFISNVSHEIKTPLAVIQNYAKLLKSDNIENNKRNDILNGLVLQTQRLSSLISSILKLNKLENQQTLPEIEHFDLAELVRVSILQYEEIIENKKLELKCDIDEISIINSKSLIEIVINNLISNAIKFTDSGEISVSLKSKNDFAVIEVKDSGCGISKEVGEHIFDKFYQGDTSHSSEGNGLGLALVKKVIELIGGEISIESKVGIGSTFTVKIKKDSYELDKESLE